MIPCSVILIIMSYTQSRVEIKAKRKGRECHGFRVVRRDGYVDIANSYEKTKADGAKAGLNGLAVAEKVEITAHFTADRILIPVFVAAVAVRNKDMTDLVQLAFIILEQCF